MNLTIAGRRDNRAPLPPPAGVAKRPFVQLRANVAIAGSATVILYAMSLASGRVGVNDGLGWDGVGYARMVTDGVSAGSIDMQTRPLLVLATRLPYALGYDIISSFEMMNWVYGFTLYLFAALLMERYGTPAGVRAVLVWNVALCMATAKMYVFYPALIDLGALALITIALYLAATDRRLAAAFACIPAVASREFGAAAALYGMHRAIRQGHPWAAVAYAPSLVTLFVIRLAVVPGANSDPTPFSLQDAIANLALWGSPWFAAAFAYFSITVFGGISILLWLRPRWSLARFRAEPELATYLVVIVGLTAAGNLDIWRYLAFAFPAAIALIAPYCHGFTRDVTRHTLIAATAATVLTQRPFERLYEAIYFRDWFPLYHFSDPARSGDFFPVWAARLAVVVLLMWATARTLGGSWRRAAA